MFLDKDQKGEQRKGRTSAARRVSSKARSGQMPGSAPGDPRMVTDSPSTNGASGSERTRVNQSVDSHRTSERSSRRAPAAVCPIQTSETLLFRKMHRISTSWHTSSAKSSSIEMGSNRKARHHRRTTSERYRVNSSIEARGRRAITSNGKRD